MGINIEARELGSLHNEILRVWKEKGAGLTEQDDREMKRAHVTVLNKGLWLFPSVHFCCGCRFYIVNPLEKDVYFNSGLAILYKCKEVRT